MGMSIVLLPHSVLMRSNEWKHNRVQKMSDVKNAQKSRDYLLARSQETWSALCPTPTVNLSNAWVRKPFSIERYAALGG